MNHSLGFLPASGAKSRAAEVWFRGLTRLRLTTVVRRSLPTAVASQGRSVQDDGSHGTLCRLPKFLLVLLRR